MGGFVVGETLDKRSRFCCATCAAVLTVSEAKGSTSCVVLSAGVGDAGDAGGGDAGNANGAASSASKSTQSVREGVLLLVGTGCSTGGLFRETARANGSAWGCTKRSDPLSVGDSALVV